MTEEIRSQAEQLKELLVRSSPLIEEYTAMVCPECSDVCCRQKHGTFREADRIYLGALGIEIPPSDPERTPEGPCQFMGPTGCVRPRWLRPFKCTWYFCEPLLAALNEGPQKKARQLSAALQEMVDCIYQLEEKVRKGEESEIAVK
ncbi:MAG TPA: hypothetical protein DCO77_14140 [Nitrospiraceae bacterium]|nr:hypothetical protein [Nitrospiraceae bacterium]